MLRSKMTKRVNAHPDLEDLPAEYDVEKLLGQGSYGLVYRGKHLPTGKKVAIKKISGIFDNQEHSNRLLREIKLLRMFKGHPNIISLEHICLPQNLAKFNELSLIFEFRETDLAQLLKSNQYLNSDHVRYFIYQILCGLQYLHSAGMVHRDLKPANLVLNANCDLAICDFGLARATALIGNTVTDMKDIAVPNKAPNQMLALPKKQEAPAKMKAETGAAAVNDTEKPAKKDADKEDEEKSKGMSSTAKIASQLPPPPRLLRYLTEHVVTRWYRSPELILLNPDYGPAVDMWSVGCILAELLMMHENSGIRPENRRALFPGTAAYPLSSDNIFDLHDSRTQLNVIFDLLGTPSDTSWIQNPATQKQIGALVKKNQKNLKKEFFWADSSALDLLQKLLVLDPRKRLTAQEALQHPFLRASLDQNAFLTHPVSRAKRGSVPLDDELSVQDYYRFEVALEEQRALAKQNNASSTSIRAKKTATKDFCKQQILVEIGHYNKKGKDKEEAKQDNVANASAKPAAANAQASVTKAVKSTFTANMNNGEQLFQHTPELTPQKDDEANEKLGL